MAMQLPFLLIFDFVNSSFSAHSNVVDVVVTLQKQLRLQRYSLNMVWNRMNMVRW